MASNIEHLFGLIPNTPLVAFTVLLLVTLAVPPFFERRLRAPGLVGLLLAGAVLGPSGIGLLDASGETEKLFFHIGQLYLMFVVGLEIDVQAFHQQRDRALGFGTAAFLLPLMAGVWVGRAFGYDWMEAGLIGVLLSSQTLLGYPVVLRQGIAKEDAVTVAVGATLVANVAALLALSTCVAARADDVSIGALMGQGLLLTVFAAVVLFGLSWAGRSYFRRVGDEEVKQLLFVLLTVFLAVVGSGLANVEASVGAFLAGLTVSNVLGDGPVKEKVAFVGGVWFIPFFFICTGLMLDIPAFWSAPSPHIRFAIALVGALLGSKFLASLTAKRLFHYNWPQAMTLWSLSISPVAIALAVALAGRQNGILSSQVFNGLILLMLATSVLGPRLTRRYGNRLPRFIAEEEALKLWANGGSIAAGRAIAAPFTVVVPINNPVTQPYLMKMATRIAQHEQGCVVPLHIVHGHVHMDEPQLLATLAQGRRLLQRAIPLSQEFEAEVNPVLRVDNDIAEGISRAAREQNANVIVMGWSPRQSLRAKLFGALSDRVFWASHCPVAATRLLVEPTHIHRILTPLKNITPQAIRTVRFAQLFADTHGAKLTLLWVCDGYTPSELIQEFEADLTAVMAEGPSAAWNLISVNHDDPAEAILKMTPNFDMVVLRSTRRRTAGGLVISDVTHRVLEQARCSVVLFGEPHS